MKNRGKVFILLLFLISCRATNFFEGIDKSSYYILVGRLDVVDEGSECKKNFITINNKIRIAADKNGYFMVKVQFDSCVITHISDLKVKENWHVKNLKPGSIYYIGDISITIKPNRVKVNVPRDYYNNNDNLTYTEWCKRTEGVNSEQYKWTKENCKKPSWSEVLVRGYFYATPSILSESEVLRVNIENNYKEFMDYFKNINTSLLAVSPNILIGNKN